MKSWDEIASANIIPPAPIMENLIPAQSVTVLYGRGGVGKTWLVLDIARCIAQGVPWNGLTTKQSKVIYIDYENSLPVLSSRLKILGDGEGVYFWLGSNPQMPAPKIDSTNWKEFLNLPAGSVLIFDTLRSAMSRSENNSSSIALVMGRLKQLRDAGHTIIILHHTRKNSNVIRGSGAIVDLVDQTLSLEVITQADNAGGLLPDEDIDRVYRLGTGEKTRYCPFHMLLTFDPDGGFCPAVDPIISILETMRDLLIDMGQVKLTAGVRACAKEIGLSIHATRRLVDKGDGTYWEVEAQGDKNAYYILPREEGINNVQEDQINQEEKIKTAKRN